MYNAIYQEKIYRAYSQRSEDTLELTLFSKFSQEGFEPWRKEYCKSVSGHEIKQYYELTYYAEVKDKKWEVLTLCEDSKNIEMLGSWVLFDTIYERVGFFDRTYNIFLVPVEGVSCYYCKKRTFEKPHFKEVKKEEIIPMTCNEFLDSYKKEYWDRA